MIDLKDLEYLLVVSKTGAINKAARQLGLTQPALTRRIQKLESQFDLKLLDRQPKGVKLTQIGENFLASSQRLLAHSRDFESEMRLHKRGRSGTIKVGIKPGLDDLFFTESLIRFSKTYPDTVIRLSVDATPALMRQLSNGELDFAFGAEGYSDDFGNEILMNQELSFAPLLEIPLIAYLRTDHPALSKPDIETVLFDYPLVGPSPPLNIVSKIEELHKSRGQNFRVPQVLADDFNFAAKLVARSDYWSAIYEPGFDKLRIYGSFTSLGQNSALPPITIGIVQRKTWTMSPWASELLTIIKNVAKPWII